MIYRRSGGSYLADREFIAYHYGLSEDVIRKRFRPVAVDDTTGRALYDLDAEAEARLRDIKPRRKRRVRGL